MRENQSELGTIPTGGHVVRMNILHRTFPLFQHYLSHLAAWKNTLGTMWVGREYSMLKTALHHTVPKSH